MNLHVYCSSWELLPISCKLHVHEHDLHVLTYFLNVYTMSLRSNYLFHWSCTVVVFDWDFFQYPAMKIEFFSVLGKVVCIHQSGINYIWHYVETVLQGLCKPWWFSDLFANICSLTAVFIFFRKYQNLVTGKK